MKKKFFLIPAFLILALSSYFVFNSFGTANTIQLPAPYFNVRVMQTGSVGYQNDAQVVYKQSGSIVHTGTTYDNGWYYTSLPSGTYDVYVYYPAQPNDAQSGSLLSFYHDGNDYETIILGGVY